MKRYYIASREALRREHFAHHAHHLSDGLHAVVVTEDHAFGKPLPDGWIALPRLLQPTPLSAEAAVLLAPDYGVVTGDTMAIAAFKIAAIHPAFDPET